MGRWCGARGCAPCSVWCVCVCVCVCVLCGVYNVCKPADAPSLAHGDCRARVPVPLYSEIGCDSLGCGVTNT